MNRRSFIKRLGVFLSGLFLVGGTVSLPDVKNVPPMPPVKEPKEEPNFTDWRGATTEDIMEDMINLKKSLIEAC